MASRYTQRRASGIRTTGEPMKDCNDEPCKVGNDGAWKAGASSGGVAQLGEHLPCKQGVRSSILLVSTIIYLYLENCTEKYQKVIPLF